MGCLEPRNVTPTGGGDGIVGGVSARLLRSSGPADSSARACAVTPRRETLRPKGRKALSFAFEPPRERRRRPRTSSAICAASPPP
ncbi:hypothetical protein PHYPSEUDO_004371 [Phytophthora pseudosyringae]|uniref:Uncharacterized protein n=1 Tax=Phytophthora pseudosyringae TaxID=221518 RepID=A0A8T1VN16_9STRA|nr:hypothetical protein PHYPSEUDO_004371 [Phytophthora pseudosyringae]